MTILSFDLQVWPWTSTYVNKCFELHFLFSKTTKLFWNPCINVQVMVRISSIYDHFDIYLTSVTLTFNLPEKMFQIALLLLEGNNCAKSFWNLCINVQVTAGQAQYMTILTFIWPLWLWPSTYLKNVSNGTSPPRGQQLCKIISKSMHKCTSYGRTSSIYDHFDIYLTPVTLTLNLLKNVSNGTFRPQGQQLCQIVLKSMHYCTSYGPDKSGRTDARTHWPTDAHSYTEQKL